MNIYTAGPIRDGRQWIVPSLLLFVALVGVAWWLLLADECHARRCARGTPRMIRDACICVEEPVP